jgi:hypothetical protein
MLTDVGGRFGSVRHRAGHVGRLVSAVFGVTVVVSACGPASSTGSSSVDMIGGRGEPAMTDAAGGPTEEDLLAFRDSAAAAPYWYTVRVDWPGTLDELAYQQTVVAIGRIQSAAISEPRADPLVPFVDAPPLYHLEVIIRVDIDRITAGRSTTDVVAVTIPVLSGGLEGLDRGQPAAERIASATPLGATVVLMASGDGIDPHLVALEAPDGRLVAYQSAMDVAFASHTISSLASALADLVST